MSHSPSMSTFTRPDSRVTSQGQTAATRRWLATAALVVFAAGAGATGNLAHAGRGSSPGAIAGAIASGSVDAISAELERSEQLMCGACVGYVRPLVDHADPRLRKVAAWWLSRRGLRGELFVEMANRLGQPDSRKAEAAADVLGSLRHPLSAKPLGAALMNPAFDVPARVAMAAALGRIGSEEARAPLNAATADSNAAVRAAAVGALRQLRDAADADVSAARLDDSDERVRIEAINTVGATRGRGVSAATAARAATTLVRLVREDQSARVRRDAAWALGEIHAPAATSSAALSAAAQQDADPGVRSLANVALSKLTR